VRERVAALLKIDDGWSGNKVAQEGLLQPRVPDTVYTWYHDWQDHGIAALYIEEGRVHDGCRDAFPPEHSSEEEARAEALRLVRRTPRSVGLDRTRWTLGLLAQKMGSIGDIPEDITRGGFSTLIGRLGISYKRGRQRMQSPDPDYDERRQYAAERLVEARTDSDVTLLYLDECGYETIPSLDRGYETKGEKQPTAAPSQSSPQQMRVAACLNATTGTVHARHAEETGRSVLIGLYREVADCYSEARVIYVVLWHLADPLPRRHDRATGAPTVALALQGAGPESFRDGGPRRADS
jgi:hypothetical protein